MRGRMTRIRVFGVFVFPWETHGGACRREQESCEVARGDGAVGQGEGSAWNGSGNGSARTGIGLSGKVVEGRTKCFYWLGN